MPPAEPRRSARLVAFSVAALAAGALNATLIVPRVAHAQAPSSTVVVPEEGLTIRSPDGRTIRLFYDARGGTFEVLGDRGDVVRFGQVPVSSSSLESSGNPGEEPLPPTRALGRRFLLERDNPWPCSSASPGSCENLGEGPIPLRAPRTSPAPQTSPKVQLERDNPWPCSSASAASCEDLGKDPIRLCARRTPPKVQLERDNPWPCSSSTAASCENLRKDPIRLRTPLTPPKVQLERDNPWP
jgi:hypothetical protein